jgi:signal transduction histidine kinase
MPLSQRTPIASADFDPAPDAGLSIVGAPRGADNGDDGIAVVARMRARQVESLDGAYLSGAANIPAVLVTAFLIRSTIPASWLYVWVALTVATIAVFIAVIRGPQPWRVEHGWAKRTLETRLAIHVLFTAAVGSVWGGACLAFGQRLGQSEMMLLSMIVIGCNAACISGLGSYLPAFFGYCLTSLVPLAYVNFIRTEPAAGELALLVALFMLTICMNVRSHNRHVLAAFRLRAENEALAENLGRANAATAAATRSKWDTLAHLSHELRTPMNAIIGFSEVMREQLFGPLAARYQLYSRDIHDSGRHALDLIDAILETSRAEAGQLTLSEREIAPFALVEECLRMVEAAAASKHVTLDRHFEQPIPRVAVDPVKLRQALLNLLTNAIKFTPEGGCVSVAAQMVDGGLDIAIADTGVGIAVNDLERCQQPFVRLRNPLTAGAEGAGLGLPLAKRLIEVHGGSLRMASEPGHGTTVTIHVPPERCRAA